MGIFGGRNGDYSVREALAKSLAGTFGIVTALAVDFLQKGQDSALVQTTSWLNQTALTQFDIGSLPPLAYVAALLIAGFVLVYVFEPDSKRNAFYAGAGVLGFLATFSPIAPPSLEVTPTDLPTVNEGVVPGPEGGTEPVTDPATDPAMPNDAQFRMFGREVIPAAFTVFGFSFGGESEVIRVQAEALPVSIRIQFPENQSADMPNISARLHDFVTRRTYTLGSGATMRETSRGPIVHYDAVLTTGETRGELIADLALRIEAPGYRIEETEVKVTRDTRIPVVLEIDMQRSNVPLALQRLRHPYKF